MTLKNNESAEVQSPAPSAPSPKITATLDEAMMLTGFGLYNVVHMLLTGSILMGMIMQSLAMGYVLPAARCDLQLTTELQGLIAAVPFAGMIVTSLVWGYLADTRGRRPVMLHTMLVSMLLTVLTSFMPDAASFGALLFVASIFMSATTAIGYTFIAEFNNVQHRDTMVAFGSSFIGLGAVVLPGIAWLILPMYLSTHIPLLGIQYRPWRLLVVASAAPYALGCIFLYFSPESPKFLHAKGRQEECLQVLKMMYAVNKLNNKDCFPVNRLTSANKDDICDNTKKTSLWKSIKEQTVPLFKMPLLPWTSLTCFVQFGIFATTNGFYVWFPTILNSLANYEQEATSICNVLEGEASQTQATLNGTIDQQLICADTINVEAFERSIYLGLLFCSMYVMSGVVVGCVGKKVLLCTTLVTTGACGVGAHLVRSHHVGVVLFAVFQMCGACIGLMNAVAVDIFPTKLRSMALCVTMLTGRLGSLLGSNLIGLLMHTHCGLGFYLFGILVVVDGLLCICLPGPAATVAPMAQEQGCYQTRD